MLVTFLGLVSASILPTVSLVIGSLSSSGRSVMKIDELAQELSRAVHTLFSILGLVAAVVALLMVIAVVPDTPWRLPYFLIQVPDAARRALQSLALLFAVAATLEAVKIPRILARVLSIKKDIAIFEARKALADKSPSDADVRQMFAKKEGFGNTIPLDSLRS
ncbi:hypothetical protein [Paracoccus sp. SY]|uniref:hypothetical protein n=1 Tax=Paracoccus sp. SY TaxID=1330255 RepID=UPI001304CA46|nr:hypothetical protein [Paracoccus sp. SY]